MGIAIESLMLTLILILFAQGLGKCFAVGIEEVLAALLPGRFHFGRGDVPVCSAFLCDGAEVLAEIFHRGAPPEPVAHVNLIDHEPGLKNNHMGNHRIVERIGVFSDVEIFLDDAPWVGEKWPMRAHAGAIFTRLGKVVSADGDKTGVRDLDLAMELNEEFGLPAVLGAEAAAAQDEYHRMRSLQFGEFAVFGGVVRKLVIGEHGAGGDVSSHRKASEGSMQGEEFRFAERWT
jgi:hypothetical protein